MPTSMKRVHARTRTEDEGSAQFQSAVPWVLPPRVATLSGYLLSCGLAVGPSGLPYFHRIEDEIDGYPIAIFALIALLLVVLSKTVAFGRIPAMSRSERLLIAVASISTILLWVPFFGQLAYEHRDVSLVVRYQVPLLALATGVFAGRFSDAGRFIDAIVLSFRVLVILLVVDIAVEVWQCGPMLCGDGRVSPGAGVPGLFQEYIYLPTLLILLVCVAHGRQALRSVDLAVVALYIVLTGSREGVLLLSCVMLLLLPARLMVVIGLAAVVALSLAIVGGDTAASGDGEGIALWRKLLQLGEEVDAQNSRTQIIGDYLRIVEASPVLGNFMLPTTSELSVFRLDQPSAHNSYVDALASGGVVGLVSLVLIVVAVASQLILTSARSRLHWNLAVFFTLFSAVSMNINVPNRAALVAVPLFFLCGLLATMKSERRSVLQPVRKRSTFSEES